jgi:hypothetical protein
MPTVRKRGGKEGGRGGGGDGEWGWDENGNQIEVGYAGKERCLQCSRKHTSEA